MSTETATIACSSYPFESHCQRRARIAVTVDGPRRLLVPLCEDCCDRVRAAGKLAESWGALTATDFARAYRPHLAHLAEHSLVVD
jgi:hypothetical protein